MMAISLKKGEGVNLRKDTGFDLSRLNVGLSWQVETTTALDYDLDAVAFLLNADGKVADLGELDANGRHTLHRGDVVFYRSLKHPSGKVVLSGDSRTGGADGKDDECISVDLDGLPERYQSIIFAVVIFKGKERGQSFAGVQRARIRAVDAQGREMCRYDIGGQSENAPHCSMIFAEVKRQQHGWLFQAIGDFHESDRFVDLLKPYFPY